MIDGRKVRKAVIPTEGGVYVNTADVNPAKR
jgi:hypothetical protein